jgi:segregation and condensation protein B
MSGESETRPTPEEKNAEEFAVEMEAEPHNIDGEPGEATPQELASAEAVSHVDEVPDREPAVKEPPPEEVPAEEPPSDEPPAQEPPAEEPDDEQPAVDEPPSESDTPAAPLEEIIAQDANGGPAGPAEEPSAEHPLSDEPRDQQLPVESPPAESDTPAAPLEEIIAQDVNGGPGEELSADEILAPDDEKEPAKWQAEDAELTAMLEAVIYITDEPLTLEQIAAALEQPRDRIKRLLAELVAEWQKPHHGLAIREVAGGYKMATKAEHHDAVRQFVKNLKPPMKLSLPALETLAVIAYKQPVTAPEIMDIRGVQGAGVLKTLIDRKLVAPAGRKNVIGKPILYKTTKEFLVQFGLKDLSELPSVKEFEELARFATSDPEPAPASPADPVSPEPQQRDLPAVADPETPVEPASE